SKGGATVYRFTTESVQRALHAGRSASDLHVFLEQPSRTGFPQPLGYLIDDLARRHGALPVGPACRCCPGRRVAAAGWADGAARAAARRGWR
ncbi:helicase-associated domain-containing protein, partial [Saccharothrix sp. ST-888]|uniref:helicase-associated domain-containing protein n=1 Tax=Saccharothrix sp. ST-888 TaxID=1427391 RepID=UPI0005ECDAC0